MSRSENKQKRLLFIGSGNIANAVACGLVSSGVVPSEYVTVYNRNSNKFAPFQKLGINTSLDLNEATKNCDMIFLAVKPAVVKDVMEQLAEIEGLLDRTLIVSFAASVSIEHIERYAKKELAVIRTMPSTPILIGEGVISVSKNNLVNAKDFQFFCRMMSSIAHVEVIDEELMNPIISVHGSSPAYVYLFIKSILDAAEEQGIDRKIALPLILKTIKGSVSMVEKCNESIETLIRNVASPNGTTLAALNSFENDGFSEIISRAMDACTKRANEITNEL